MKFFEMYTEGGMAEEHQKGKSLAEESEGEQWSAEQDDALLYIIEGGMGVTFRPRFGSADLLLGGQISVGQRLAARWARRHLPASQIETILVIATEVLGDRTKAAQWLTQSNVALENEAPIDLIGSENGFDRVKTLLLRIEYGVLA